MATFVETSDGYDLWASEYDAFANPLIAMTEWALERHPLAVEGLHVMELGCGTGRNLARILDSGAGAYTGLDGSEGMLRIARQRAQSERVRFLQANLEGPLHLAVDPADLVLIVLVLEHVETLTPFFQTAFSLLRPGGTIRLLEIHPDLVRLGTHAHFWHNGEEHRFRSFAHEADEIQFALVREGFDLIECTELFAHPEVIRTHAKLGKHKGRGVLLDISAAKHS